MPKGRKSEDLTTLQMALVGYEIERRKIEDKIRELQGRLKGKSVTLSSGASAKKARRALSPAARKRIAMAQKKRWAEFRKRQTAKA